MGCNQDTLFANELLRGPWFGPWFGPGNALIGSINAIPVKSGQLYPGNALIRSINAILVKLGQLYPDYAIGA
jgi:hypothetical protein